MKEINNLSLKDAALEYLEMGFPIVPRYPNSKKFLFLKPNHGSVDNPLTAKGDIEKVWKEHPEANISIKSPGLIIIDIDQHEKSNGVDKAKEMNLPKTLAQETPNNGLHLIYKNPEKRKIKIADAGIDYISGDYCLMMAPSILNGKKYEFANEREIIDFEYSLIPEKKIDTVTGKGRIPDIIEDGERNQQLTRLAGKYAGKGLSYDEIFTALWGENLLKCDPPKDKDEVRTIANSIHNREQSKSDTLKSRIEEFIKDDTGFFTLSQLDSELGIMQSEKNNRKQILHRMTQDGKLERGNQRGLYRICDYQLAPLDFVNVKDAEVSLPLPLELSNHASVMPGDIVVIAGSTNGGKTCFVMNLVHSILNGQAAKITDITGEKVSRNARISENYVYFNQYGKNIPHSKPVSVLLNEQMNSKSDPVNVRYLIAEGNPTIFKKRANNFSGGLNSFIKHPNFQHSNRQNSFQDVIDPNGINIIDYLRIYDNFWLIGDTITKILNKLENGIAIICIQKRSDKDFARGGEFSIENSALAFNLDTNKPHGHTATIMKLKYPIGENIDGMSRDFKIGGGANIKTISDWMYVKDKKQRSKINAEYEANENQSRIIENTPKTVKDLM
ncbi:MAG: bifunctional DNA primase/polymerase [Desulfobacterium sp.]|nr:bifunctional DNA primase/polymerase [Desulfobacterium sp.]